MSPFEKKNDVIAQVPQDGILSYTYNLEKRLRDLQEKMGEMVEHEVVIQTSRRLLKHFGWGVGLGLFFGVLIGWRIWK